MNKICGYNCEHNKGGICQITVCDKHIYLNTSTTVKPEVLTRWVEPTIQEYKKEIDRLNNIINELEKYIEERRTYYCTGCSNIYEDSLGKTRLVNEDVFNEITKIKDKLKELKEGK